jgi:hypothetical protein
MVGVGQVDLIEWTAIEHLVSQLKQNYPEVPADTVATAVHRNHARFDGRPVRDFVPLFVERGAREELRQLDSLRPVQ